MGNLISGTQSAAPRSEVFLKAQTTPILQMGKLRLREPSGWPKAPSGPVGLAALASLDRTPLSRSLTIIFQSHRFSVTTSILPARSREEGQLAQVTGAPGKPLSAALGRYDYYCCCCCYCSPGAQPDPDGESEAWRSSLP